MTTPSPLELALAEAVQSRLADEGTEADAQAIAEFFAHRNFPDDHFWAAWDNTIRDMTEFFKGANK